MAPKRVDIEEVPTEADIKRGDEVLKRMLQTKPKPHKEMIGQHRPATKPAGRKGPAGRSDKK